MAHLDFQVFSCLTPILHPARGAYATMQAMGSSHGTRAVGGGLLCELHALAQPAGVAA
jgi:hypothetical protein